MEFFDCCSCRIAAINEPIGETAPNNCDVVVYSHRAFSLPVNLFDELSGKTRDLAKVVALSVSSVAVVGINLEYGPIKRLSAAVAANSQLVDIADGCSVSEPYSRAGSVKIYSAKNARFAVLVGGDSRVRFIMQKVAPLCDFALALEPEYRSENELRVKKLAREFALPVVYVSSARAFFANGK